MLFFLEGGAPRFFHGAADFILPPDQIRLIGWRGVVPDCANALLINIIDKHVISCRKKVYVGGGGGTKISPNFGLGYA